MASTFPDRRLGTSPAPPTGTRVIAPPASFAAHNAKKSVVDPFEVIPTFFPTRSFGVLAVEFLPTTRCHPRGVTVPALTIVALTPLLLARASPGGKKLTRSTSPAARPSMDADPPAKLVNTTFTPALSKSFNSCAAATGSTGP